MIGSGTYTTATNGFNPVEIRIAGPMDGNPWDGANGTLIAVFADGKADPFFCYRKTGVGYTNNYITLLGYGATHGVDDFRVGTDATAVASNMSLKVDFQAAADSVTQLGFFDLNLNDAGGASYPTAAGPVTVAVSGQSGFFNRGGVVNSGNLTFAAVYNDFVYKNGAALTSPQSLTLTLSGAGILPNKRYRLTFYSYDDLIGSAHSVSFSGASGTTGSAGPLLYTSNQDPTSNSAYSVTGFFKANSSGTLTVLATDTFSGSSGIRLNAFEIVSDFLPKGTIVSFH